MSNDKGYYNAMQEAIRRDRLLLEQDYARLKVRNAQLEQLVKAYRTLAKQAPVREFFREECERLEAQYNALVEQEVK